MMKIFNIQPAKCWKCGNIFNICMIDYGTEYSKRPDNFSIKDIEYAKKQGIKIEKRYSQGFGYINACICPHCNNFYGNHFVLDDFMSAELGNGLSEIKNIVIGKI